ncbi:MAG: ferrous iron transport protein B [Betaproteobacteria bacterium RBG_16_58_11]|nr:MAG: ferrous iron transport protein B [Betaproteobacteria bacterium RBG_16_58_11]
MKRIALLGMPNTGKSTFFNRITGASARVGNWPGVTVDLMGAKVLIGAEMVEIVDLPGIYDMHGFSDDEQVVRHFLENNAVDLVLIILNSCQLDRQLSLALQLKQLNLPNLLLLNMADEAKRFGVTVDANKMAAKLDMPVLMLSAKYGEGYKQAFDQISQALRHSRTVQPERMREVLSADVEIEHAMEQVLKESVQIPPQLSDNLTARLDRIMLHPWLGLPIFFGVMYLLFQAIFLLGAPLQAGVAWTLDGLRHMALEPVLAYAPEMLRGVLLDGIYTGVSTVAAFVPIIILFFLFMAVVEDTGYLSRAAFLMDALMARMGLDGRSFVMMLMGFGCNVPALMGTRVMRSRALRLLTMLVIPLSLCSARLQVFIFITAALFSPKAAPLVLFSLYLFSFGTAFLTAMLFKRKYASQEPFVLELPPYRFPTLRQIALRGWHEVRHFLNRASKFIIAGVVLVWFLTHFPTGVAPASAQTWAGAIGQFMAPVLDPLGINTQLAIALIFGFVAKEIVIGSLAVIYGLESTALTQHLAHQIDWVQAYSFMLFTLVYTPCLSTIATLRSESGKLGFAAFAVSWSLGLAWLLSFIFYQSARALGF